MSTGNLLPTLIMAGPYYREQLQNNANKGLYFIKVDFEDLLNFDEQLGNTSRTYPTEYLPLVSKHIIVIQLYLLFSSRKRFSMSTKLTISIKTFKKETMFPSSRCRSTLMRTPAC